MSTARVIQYIRDGAPAVGGVSVSAMVREFVLDCGSSFNDALQRLNELAGLNNDDLTSLNNDQRIRLARARQELTLQRRTFFSGERPESMVDELLAEAHGIKLVEPAGQVEQDGVWVVLRRDMGSVGHVGISSFWKTEAEAAAVAAASFDLKVAFLPYGEH